MYYSVTAFPKVDNVFLALLLLTPVFWLVAMAKPSLFSRLPINKLNRIKLTGLSVAMLVTTFVGFGLTTDYTQIESNREVKTPSPTQSPTEAVDEKSVQRDEVEGVSSEIIIANSPTTTSDPTHSPTATNVPTRIPTIVPTKIIIPTRVPTIKISNPTSVPTNNSNGNWVCNCSLTCETGISSCAQAQWLLKTCGCSARDRDKDGIACDSAPLHCQN